MNGDDSGAAAVKVPKELKELRHECDQLDIKWHPRHKAESLRDKIRFVADVPRIKIKPEVETVAMESETAVTSSSGVAVEYREKRTIPQDISEALDYMTAYRKAYADKVRAYIESLL